MFPSINSLWAFVGGVVPAIFWLWFWLHEDKKHPEPKMRIFASFALGMAAIFIAIEVERYFYNLSGKAITIWLILIWAATEEIVKFGAAYFGGLRYRTADEPVDFLIYMVSAALGFSAIENSLFLGNMISSGLLAQTVVSGQLRFLGATLLHIVSSASIGAFLALSFYKTKEVRRLSLVFGILLSIALHTIFNFFIMHYNQRVFFIFMGVWVVALGMIFMFEKIKQVRPSTND